MQQIDLLPTLLDALDIETPASGARGGRSLLPLLDRARAEPRESREQAIVSLVDVDGARWQSVRSAEWRLIRRPGPGGLVEELYRSSDDPAETRNLAASEPQVVARLRAELDRAASRAATAASTPEAATIDRKLKRELRALGYL